MIIAAICVQPVLFAWAIREAAVCVTVLPFPQTEGYKLTLKSIILDFFPLTIPQKSHRASLPNEVGTRPALTTKCPIWALIWTHGSSEMDRCEGWRVICRITSRKYNRILIKWVCSCHCNKSSPRPVVRSLYCLTCPHSSIMSCFIGTFKYCMLLSKDYNKVYQLY